MIPKDSYYSPHSLRWRSVCDWADRMPQRCGCKNPKPRKIDVHTGYSDSAVIEYVCLNCGVSYVKYSEG